MITPEQLLAIVDQHLFDTRTTATRFGMDVMGDPNFVFDLRSGRNPKLSNVKKVLDEIARRNTEASAA